MAKIQPGGSHSGSPHEHRGGEGVIEAVHDNRCDERPGSTRARSRVHLWASHAASASHWNGT